MEAEREGGREREREGGRNGQREGRREGGGRENGYNYIYVCDRLHINRPFTAFT